MHLAPRSPIFLFLWPRMSDSSRRCRLATSICVFRPITLTAHWAGSHTICQQWLSHPRCDLGAVEAFTVLETDTRHAAITSSSNFEQNVNLSETAGFVKRTYSGATKCSQQPAKVVFHGRGSHKTCARAAKAAAICIIIMFSRLATRWMTRNMTRKYHLPIPGYKEVLSIPGLSRGDPSLCGAGRADQKPWHGKMEATNRSVLRMIICKPMSRVIDGMARFC